MFTARITFRFDSGVDVEARIGAAGWLLAAWQKQGRAVGEARLARTHDGIDVFLLLPEPDALDPRFDDPFAAEVRAPWPEEAIAVSVLGEEPGSAPVCACARSTESVVRVVSASPEGTPVRCLECFGVRPLYHFPPEPVGDAFGALLAWERQQLACWTLWLESDAGERFAMQLESPDAPLQREGRDVAAELEARCGAPVFLFLPNLGARGRVEGPTRPCPGCGEAWWLAEPDGPVDYRCDACRLVSEVDPETDRAALGDSAR